jgi:hypothetical protein
MANLVAVLLWGEETTGRYCKCPDERQQKTVQQENKD